MAKVKFLMQGQSEKENHRLAFEELKNVGDIKKVYISTAFLSSNGVEAIKKTLTEIKSDITVFVGIRNGITSIQGINSLLDIGISPYTVDTGSSTFIFHPKTYLACSDDKAIAIVGSANITLGGLVRNIEASDVLELNIYNDQDDIKYVENMEMAFENLINNYPENVTLITSKEQSDNLLKDGKLIDEEYVSSRSYGTSFAKKKTVTPFMMIKTENLNGIIIRKKGKRKKLVKDTSMPESTTVVTAGTVISASIEQAIGSQLKEVWESKPLKERDLNIPTGNNTHATGSMTLKKGEYDDIDQRTYFRDDVFNKLTWVNSATKTKAHLEYASAEFSLIIEGINYGKYTLGLKHDPRTDTASYIENNAMTHLLWKDAKQFIANRNLLGKKLKLYAVLNTNNEFVIEIIDTKVDE